LIPFKPGSPLLCLDFPPGSPAEELALDEVLFREAESREGTGILRFWEPSSHFVVLGYTNKADAEVNLLECRSRGIPAYRRCTGGGTVLQGPGCLNFCLVLPISASPRFGSAHGVNTLIMERHAAIVRRLKGMPVEIRGVTDLTVSGRKVSGNAQRRGQRAFLFHGSFLLDFQIGLTEAVLRVPTRAPAYRGGRSHRDFMGNLHLRSADLRDALREGWEATSPLPASPPPAVAVLANERANDQRWRVK
jgi:lipoate-protein ligase A